MIDPLAIIKKYYDEDSKLYHILVTHSKEVTEKALKIVDAHSELGADRRFVEEGAMLHDIGIFKTSAAGICCDGDQPYICHGYLGSELLQAEGLPRHAMVAERHTGTGLSLKQIIEQNLPVPHRDMRPVSIEEQIICFADKFFSKTHLGEERTFIQSRQKLEKFGEESVKQFDEWGKMFL